MRYAFKVYMQWIYKTIVYQGVIRQNLYHALVPVAAGKLQKTNRAEVAGMAGVAGKAIAASLAHSSRKQISISFPIRKLLNFIFSLNLTVIHFIS